eukprot:TRINITY_DN9812_c0_g3_i1.p2 TRINITY_DN9812_c0_g3~~TRINITY_DN9812_c0_g3_i1.p2  ORF type:complete len:180 (+),score=17.43 TRINITY_DN9812_c0_g3_i1:1897-2436(+)
MPFFEFVKHQIELMFATKPASEQVVRRKTHFQSIVVSASSLCYLYPAVVCSIKGGDSSWFRFGSYLYVGVASFSALADGSLLEPPWFAKNDRAHSKWQIFDRWLAMSGGLYAVLNLYHPRNTLSDYGMITLCGVAVCSTLHFARKTKEKNIWTWIAWQSLWHLTSAAWIVYIITRHDDY